MKQLNLLDRDPTDIEIEALGADELEPKSRPPVRGLRRAKRVPLLPREEVIVASEAYL